MMIAVLYLNSQCEHYALLVICHKYQFAYLLCYPFCPFFKQTNKQILYYPQTLYSVQGVKTSNKYIVVRHLQHKYI